jgi:hexosaminidase
VRAAELAAAQMAAHSRPASVPPASLLLLLLRALVSILLAGDVMVSSVVPDDFMPLFPAPNGALSNGSLTLEVSSALSFKLNTSAPIVADAAARYSKIMFAWGEQDCTDEARAGCVQEVSIGVANTSTELQLGVNESYTLTVSSEGAVHIEAPEVWGAIHALESLSQLIVWSVTAHTYQLANVPWHVSDSPRFPHRAVMIDTARHWLPVETIKRQIDAAAYCKLNTIQ